MQLEWRQTLAGRRIWLAVILLALPVLLTVAVRAAGGFDAPNLPKDAGVTQADLQTGIAGVYLYVLYPMLSCGLLSLLYGSSLLASEIEGRTLTYLFTRPLPKWQIVLGKYLTVVCVLCVLISSSLTLSWTIIGGSGGVKLWFSLLIACVGAVTSLVAIFALLGQLVPRRAIPAGIVYLVVFEGLLSLLPAVVHKASVHFYLRSLVFGLNDLKLPDEVMDLIGPQSVPASCLALCLITAGALGGAMLQVTRRQFTMSDGG